LVLLSWLQKNRSIKKNFNAIGCKNVGTGFGYAFLAVKKLVQEN
jgi:hypothetical protein